MNIFERIKASAAAELQTLEGDSRAIGERLLEAVHLGALHGQIAQVEARFAADVKKLREGTDSLISQLREQFKAATTTPTPNIAPAPAAGAPTLTETSGTPAAL